MPTRSPGRLLTLVVILYSLSGTGSSAETGLPPAQKNASFEVLGTITGSRPLALIKSHSGKQLLGINGSFGIYRIIAIKKSGIEVSFNNKTRWLPLALRIDLDDDTDNIATNTSINIRASLLKDIGNNPQKWLSAVELEPVVEEGWLAGYRISLIRTPELLNNLNLQEGDIIRQINGIDVRQAKRFSEVINNLSNETDIYFTLQRNQQRLQLHFSVTH